MSYHLLLALPFILGAIIMDLKVQKIPDLSSWGIACIGIFRMIQLENFQPFISLGIILFTLGVIQLVFTKGLHKKALGEGDFYLILVSALWISPLALPQFAVIAGICGIFTAVLWRFLFHSLQFPFAPAILLSMVFCIYFPEGSFS